MAISTAHIEYDIEREKKSYDACTGEIDLPQRLRVAERNSCRCVVETKTAEALKESVEWLGKTRK